MLDVHPDIKIYIKKLQTFFLTEPQHYKALFGDSKAYDVFRHIVKDALKNFNEFDDPTLTVEQFEAISALLKKKTGVLHTLPPICAN